MCCIIKIDVNTCYRPSGGIFMFCENCGAKIADTAKFCRYCGAKQLPLTEEAPVSAPKQQQNPSVSKASKTSATQKTEKQALIDHLGALYAAEMGVIRSEQLIQELETQKNAFVTVTAHNSNPNILSIRCPRATIIFKRPATRSRVCKRESTICNTPATRFDPKKTTSSSIRWSGFP